MKIKWPLLALILGFIMSCGNQKKIPSSDQLYDHTWQLEYFSGPRIAFEGLFPDKKPEIAFNKSISEVIGNSSCNGFSASYSLNGSAISFGDPGPTTMMYCGEGEPQFLAMMKKINGYRFDAEGKLNLMIDEVSMMRFKKTQKTKGITSETMKSSKNSAAPSIYFKANGTEPFWDVAISKTQIVFKTPSDSIIIPHSKPILAQDANVKRYNLDTESGRMSIQIIQKECKNAMSGKVLPYSVTVEKHASDETDVVKLEGCGVYITDYRLHDTWVLETLNGNTLTRADFAKEFPTLEMNTAENTFHGFAGCNQMHGSLFSEKDLLKFIKVATTEMLCEEKNKESEFLKALLSSTTYSIENNRLTLSNPSGVLAVLKKID